MRRISETLLRQNRLETEPVRSDGLKTLDRHTAETIFAVVAAWSLNSLETSPQDHGRPCATR